MWSYQRRNWLVTARQCIWMLVTYSRCFLLQSAAIVGQMSISKVRHLFIIALAGCCRDMVSWGFSSSPSCEAEAWGSFWSRCRPPRGVSAWTAGRECSTDCCSGFGGISRHSWSKCNLAQFRRRKIERIWPACIPPASRGTFASCRVSSSFRTRRVGFSLARLSVQRRSLCWSSPSKARTRHSRFQRRPFALRPLLGLRVRRDRHSAFRCQWPRPADFDWSSLLHSATPWGPRPAGSSLSIDLVCSFPYLSPY